MIKREIRTCKRDLYNSRRNLIKIGSKMIAGKKHVGFRVKMNLFDASCPFSTVSRKLHPSVCSPIRPYKRKPRQKAREIVAVYKREKRTNEPTRPPLNLLLPYFCHIFAGDNARKHGDTLRPSLGGSEPFPIFPPRFDI